MKFCEHRTKKETRFFVAGACKVRNEGVYSGDGLICWMKLRLADSEDLMAFI